MFTEVDQALEWVMSRHGHSHDPEEMKQILDKVSDIEDGFPFETVIESEVFDGNKVKYSFT